MMMHFPTLDYLVRAKHIEYSAVADLSGPTEEAVLDQLVSKGLLTEADIREARMAIAKETGDSLIAMKQARRSLRVFSKSGEAVPTVRVAQKSSVG